MQEGGWFARFCIYNLLRPAEQSTTEKQSANVAVESLQHAALDFQHCRRGHRLGDRLVASGSCQFGQSDEPKTCLNPKLQTSRIVSGDNALSWAMREASGHLRGRVSTFLLRCHCVALNLDS